MLPLSNILEKINPLEKNQSSGEFCLGLVISEKKVRSAIWNLSAGEGEEITFGSSETWGNDSAEELIVAADASIATAVTKLPHLNGKQPTKVILGLPEHWVEGNGVNKKKSEILQALCRKLLLKSLGFVVTPEAIAHFLKKEEGGSPSIILVNLAETEMVVSLISEGKFVGSKVVGRSDNLALDLEEGLLRFNHQGTLPNRILLLEDADVGDIEELRQTLVAYPWVGPENGGKLSFLQFPRVEIAEDGFEVKAVMIAGKHELGLSEEKEPAAVSQEEMVPEPAAAVEKTAAVIAEKPAEKVAEIKEENLVEKDFGFVKGEDILLTEAGVLAEESPPSPETFAATEEVTPPKPETPVFSLPRRLFSRLSFQGLKSLPHFPLTRPAFSFAPRRGFVLAIGSLVFVLGMGFFSFWRFARAQVKVFVQPKRVEKEFEFSVSEAAGTVDSEKMVVPAREMTVEVSGSKTGEVKGKKTVGDKAKGEVVIYNRTDQAKTLPKASVLKGAGGLKFALNDEAKVASKTADLVNGVDKWGEVKVAVTAGDIGAQYNLAANSPLTLDAFPTTALLVKNPTAFSGGTSREIQAVSSEDRESLQKALLAELEAKAKGELKAKLGENDHPLSETVLLKNKTDRFNHELGAEATTLTLEEKAVFSLAYVKDEDFRILADKAVADLVPSGYQKKPLKEEKSSAVKDKVKGIYTARVKEEFLPEMAVAEIPAKLKGRTFGQGEDYLKGLNQLIGMEVMIRPKPFAFLKIFPLREKNISVTVETL